MFVKIVDPLAMVLPGMIIFQALNRISEDVAVNKAAKAAGKPSKLSMEFILGIIVVGGIFVTMYVTDFVTDPDHKKACMWAMVVLYLLYSISMAPQVWSKEGGATTFEKVFNVAGIAVPVLGAIGLGVSSYPKKAPSTTEMV
jgi:hypothetical protein